MFIIKDLKFTKKIFYSFFLISLLPQIIISKEKDNSIVPKKKEKIIIVVSHKNIKQNIFDKTYMMENGKIYAEEKNA